MSDILSVDDYMASKRQMFTHSRSAAFTTIANASYVGRALAGFPSSGANLTLAVTANGAVPDQTLTGVPPIEAFDAGGTGYITMVQYTSNVACQLMLVDRLYHVGSFSLTNATTAIASAPSYAARLPLYGGLANYRGLRIFAEISTVVQNTAVSVSANYVDIDNVTARTTTATSVQNFTVNRVIELTQPSGSQGVHHITDFVCTAAATGAVNLFVARPLWVGRVAGPNSGSRDGMNECGRPQVFQSSCLDLIVTPDSTAFGTPVVRFEVASSV